MQSFFNQATLSYNGITLASNVTRGTVADILSATKTAVEPTYTKDSENTFVINLVNSGATALTGLTLNDNMGGYAFNAGTENAQTLYPLTYRDGSVQYYVNGVRQPSPTVTDTDGMTITGINIPAGGNATIVYAVNANEFAPLDNGASIVNTATLTGPGINLPVTAQATVSTAAAPLLDITKSLNPQTVTGGAPVTYTFNITNTGAVAATADDNVQVRDTFTPPLANLTVTLDGIPLDTTQYTYNEQTGEFATNPGVITVPAAAFLQNAGSGAYSASPGEAILQVTGTMTP